MVKIYSLFILLSISLFQFSAIAKLNTLDLSTLNRDIFMNKGNIYSQIIFVDDRPEIEKKDLKIDEISVDNLLNSWLPKVDSDKTLMIQLIKLYQLSENGTKYYYIQARAYEQNSSNEFSFFWINTLNDSFMNQYSDKEVNTKIGSILVDFIKEQLSQAPKSYSIENETSDFSNMSDIEKQEMYVYQTDVLIDGIYATYGSFVQQQPDKEISKSKFKKFELKDVSYLDNANEKEIKVKDGTIFGVVIENSLFIQDKGKYIELFRDFDYNEFYFYNTKKSSTSIGVGFGLIGALLIPTNSKEEESRVVLDHLSGELTLAYKNVVETSQNVFRKKSKEKVVEGDGSLKRSW